MKIGHYKPLSSSTEKPFLLFFKNNSYTFEDEIQGGFYSYLPISYSVTTDISAILFDLLIEWKKVPAQWLPIQSFELKEFEETMEKIRALESISGILNELTPEQLEIFEEEIKRKPLFE